MATLPLIRCGRNGLGRHVLQCAGQAAALLLGNADAPRGGEGWQTSCASRVISVRPASGDLPVVRPHPSRPHAPRRGAPHRNRCGYAAIRAGAGTASSRIIAAAFSPIMMVGALVFPATTTGMIEA